MPVAGTADLPCIRAPPARSRGLTIAGEFGLCALVAFVPGARQSFLAGLNSAGIQIAPGPLPSTASAGDLVLDASNSNLLKIYNGSSWVTLNPTITLPPGNYVATFTAQTSITVTGATHGLGTPNLLVQCYDNATPSPNEAHRPARTQTRNVRSMKRIVGSAIRSGA